MRRSGFTLFETLITLTLVFLVLGVATQLLQEYSAVLNASQLKTTSLAGTQVALQEMVDEARQSVLLEVPTLSLAPGDLKFEEVSQGASWLPNPLPNPLPGSWSPQAPAYLVEVHYFLQGAALLRTMGPIGQAPNVTTPVADSVSGMQVVLLPGKAIQVQLSLLLQQGLLVLTTTSMEPVL